MLLSVLIKLCLQNHNGDQGNPAFMSSHISCNWNKVTAGGPLLSSLKYPSATRTLTHMHTDSHFASALASSFTCLVSRTENKTSKHPNRGALICPPSWIIQRHAGGPWCAVTGSGCLPPPLGSTIGVFIIDAPDQAVRARACLFVWARLHAVRSCSHVPKMPLTAGEQHRRNQSPPERPVRMVKRP